MKTLLILAFTLILFSVSQAQAAPFTFNNDRTVYPLPPLPSLPPVGGSFNDPTFGTPILRLTDENDGDRCWQIYSATWPAFNKDSTQIWVYCHLPSGGERYKIYDLDPTNFKIVSKYEINRITPSGAYISGDQAFWSGIDPNIIYIPDRNSILYSYNTRTKQYTQLKDFRSIIPTGGYFTRDSMSLDNDNFFAFVVSTATTEYIKHFVWKRDEDKVILSIDKSPTADLYKGATLSKDGRYVKISYANNPPASATGELLSETYDLSTGQVVRRLYDVFPSVGLSHNDLGRTYDLGWSPVWNKMISVDYAGDPNQYTSLFSFGSDWTQAGHTSFRNSEETFGIQEKYDDNVSLTAPTQGFLHNEIFAFATDGSENFRRLVHHRSFLHPNMPSSLRYWATPRVSVSQDGRFIAWTSNWENQGSSDWSKIRLDVFIAKIDSTTSSPTISSFTAFPSSITSGQPSTLSWSVAGNPSPSLTIDNGIGDVTGLSSKFVSPATTTTYTLTATNSSGSATKSVTVTVTTSPDTTPPTIPTNLTATAISSTQINLSWSASTDNVGVTGYKVYRAGTQIATVTSGTSYADTGLTPSTTYSYTVSAYDAAGNNSSQSSPVSTTTLAPPDTIPPTVSITSPTNGQTVSGAIIVSANASDPSTGSGQVSGVAGVQFKLDGINLGAEDTISPYSASFDTTAYSNGPHALTAIARDNAGNVKTSEAVAVTISNTTPPPPTPTLSVTLSISPLAGNAPLSVDLTAIASTTATATLSFTFYCNRPDSGVDITSGFDKQVTNVSTQTQIYSCAYGEAKTYTPKVIVTSGSLVAEDRRAVTVSPPVITNPPVIFSFTATPAIITKSQSATLSWAASNATTLSIDQGVGQVTPTEGSGSVTVFPTITTTYTLTAANVAGSVTQDVTVTVSSDVYQTRLINNQGTYYFIRNSQKLGITSPGILYSYGFDFPDALPATDADLSLPLGEPILPENGSLVKVPQNPTVYLISEGQRRGFTSALVFTALGFKFSSILTVTTPELDKLPEGLPLSDPALPHPSGVDIIQDGTVYWLNQGVKHPYPSLEIYNSWHKDNDFSTVVLANSADLSIPIGEFVIRRIIE